jgi:hypothetical protein
MFELTMTANSGDECPSIISEKLEYLTNFHGAYMIGESVDEEKPYNYLIYVNSSHNTLIWGIMHHHA